MVVRKVSIGLDFKSSMNYILGQTVLGGSNVIYDMIEVNDTTTDIWIKNHKDEIVKWKRISTPHTIEYNINI